MKKLLLLFIIVLLSGCSNAEDDQPEDLLPLDFNEITTDRIDNCSDCFGTETENFDKIADFDTYLFDMMLEFR
jgi:PBP1b-binding outer membrane lipoprotein LpoB